MLREPTTAQVDKATETLYQLGRYIWRGHGTNMVPYIGTCLGIMVGDIQRQSRRMFEGTRPDIPAGGNGSGHPRAAPRPLQGAPAPGPGETHRGRRRDATPLRQRALT